MISSKSSKIGERNRSFQGAVQLVVILTLIAIVFAAPQSAFAQVPTVTTNAPTGITDTQAAFSGTYSGSGITGRGFYYGTDPDPVNNGAKVNSSFNIGTYFERTQGSLTPATNYYVAAWAANGSGEGQGSVMMFTTLPPPPPVVTTNAASSITAGSAIFSGTHDGSGITGQGFYYGTDPDPINNGLKVNGTNAGGNNFERNQGSLTQGTTYYYAAWASNAGGEGQGSVVQFTTAVTPPVVTTNAASQIGNTTAFLNGSHDGNAITGSGFYWGTDPDPINNGTKSNSTGTIVNTFERSLTGLTLGTTYYYAAWAANAGGEGQGAVMQFTTTNNPPPVVTTNAADQITNTSAFVHGSHDGSGVTGSGFYWGTDPDPINNGTRSNSTGTIVNTFERNLVGLTPVTTYYFAAWAENAYGEGQGAVMQFTTSGTIPSVTTNAFVFGGTTDGNLSGSITNSGVPSTITERGFYWGTGADPVNTGAKVQSADASATFDFAVAGLTPGTTYYYVAYAINAAGEGQGAIVQFTTTGTVPTVVTNDVNPVDISSTQAALTANITDNGVPNTITARGFYYGTDPDPINNGTKVNAGFYSGNYFEKTQTGLLPGTTYYFAAYAGNGTGEGVGAIKSFTTIAALVPTVITRDVAPGDLSFDTVGLEGEITDNGVPTSILARGFYFGTDPDPINNGTKLNAQFQSGNFFFRTETGLTPNTTYYYAACATNGSGEGCGVIKSFTTPGKYTVTILTAPNGHTDKDGANIVSGGDSFTVIATPDALYSFSQWTGDASGTNATLTIPSVNSDLTITPVFARSMGSLDVSIVNNPGAATFTIQGPSDFNSGVDFVGNSFPAQNVPTGTYTVIYDLAANTQLSVTSSQLTVNPFHTASGDVNENDVVTVVGTYLIDYGTLNVNLVGAPAGAAYTITGPATFNGGAPLANQTVNFSAAVPLGTYTVSFVQVGGYGLTVSATSFTVVGSLASGSIAKDATETVSGTYASEGSTTASLKVTILPLGAVNNGAGWKTLQFPGDPYFASNYIKTGLTPGQVTVTFDGATGYTTPNNVTIYKLPGGEITQLTVIYSKGDGPSGGVIVDDESNPPSEGGWRPTGGSPASVMLAGTDDDYFDLGEIVSNLPTGKIEIEFKPVPGYIQPANRTITVNANKQTKVFADYIRPFVADTNDYNGDGRTDLAVFDADSGTWSAATVAGNNGMRKAKEIFNANVSNANAVPTPGDYDGDGISDVALFKLGGSWNVDGQFAINRFGSTVDIPVPADYDGDGMTDAALYNPHSGRWTMMLSGSGQVKTLVFGGPDYIPVPGDYDGSMDGYADLGIYSVIDGSWMALPYDADQGDYANDALEVGKLGKVGDVPVPGDYNGDGKTDMAVYRPDDALWLVKGEDDLKIGRPGDIPVPGDWDGDGTTDPAVFQAKKGRWLIYIGKIFKTKFGKGAMPISVQH